MDRDPVTAGAHALEVLRDRRRTLRDQFSRALVKERDHFGQSFGPDALATALRSPRQRDRHQHLAPARHEVPEGFLVRRAAKQLRRVRAFEVSAAPLAGTFTHGQATVI